MDTASVDTKQIPDAKLLTPRGETPVPQPPSSHSLSRRLILGFAWSMAGSVIARGLNLAGSVIAARLLGKSGYGELGMVQSTVGMFGVFAGLGMGLTATKYIAEWREKDPCRAGRIGVLSLLFALMAGAFVTAVLVLTAPWLASKTLAAPELTFPLAIGSGLLFFGVVNGVQTGMLAGMEAFKSIATASLWAGICSLPLIVGGTWYGGLNGAIVGLVTSLGLNVFFNSRALRREASNARIPLNLRGCWKEKSILWRFSLPAFFADAAIVPAAWACNAMLVNRPRGYGELGLFNAANQWRMAIIFLPVVFSKVLLPVLSSSSGHSDEEAKRFDSSLDAGFSVAISVALPAITLLSFGGEFIAMAYGKDFSGMALPLAGTLCAAGVMALGAPSGLAIQAKGKMWLGMWINCALACLLIGSFFFLVRYGAWGLALDYAFSFMCVTFLMLWYVCWAGLYPWNLGVRTYVACTVVAFFSFTPIFLQPRLTHELSPVAFLCTIIATAVLIPRRSRNVFRARAQALFFGLVNG